VRLVLEGGSGTGWSGAWKEVFRGTVPISSTINQRENVRQVRDWVTEFKGMAGRGWNGWGWGCAKDVCGELCLDMSLGIFTSLAGFATFFAIFDMTRRGASRTKFALQDVTESWNIGGHRTQSLKRHFPRIVHGLTLVSGGVVAGLAYEFVSRPFDVARKVVQRDRIAHTRGRGLAMMIVIEKIRQDGILIFFRDSGGHNSANAPGSAGVGESTSLYVLSLALDRGALDFWCGRHSDQDYHDTLPRRIIPVMYRWGTRQDSRTSIVWASALVQATVDYSRGV